MLIYRKPDRCLVCSGVLQPHFRGVEDRVYDIAGKWDIDRCAKESCAVLHLAHDLTAEQLASFYANYSTHSSPVLAATGLKAIYRRGLKHIIHRTLGYPTAQTGYAAIVGTMLQLVPYFREMAKSRVFWLPFLHGGRAIEVGFGNGQSMALLRDAGWEVTGSELDPACVTLAREMGFDAQIGEFTEGLFNKESADAVVSSHTIEHVPNPRAFFAEAWRVLKPGGRLVLRTPNAMSSDATKTGKDWRGLEVPRHLSIHTIGSLTALATEAGFCKSSVRGTPLGGFIVQQSVELHTGQKPAARQSAKTVRYDALETMRSVINHRNCDEIFLTCVKAAS